LENTGNGYEVRKSTVKDKVLLEESPENKEEVSIRL
jgi:hypothetical protein